ncbi:hypothetical protein TVAG_487700 [Trichomonas vaginalis G3]|uniref:Uncharacterized protein n=1 Tax=Trichomonas vaginalis (strain ATCC PRA-98 / G3) TaxID=412133 RepID=A2EFP8_TRIV3|nr:hypothetical protein TVAGG3_0062540 [Trichomonas vaginalis G3]EAY08543.1 hypothetical protein TVAG_487700 [Trichomonas vaginalis G3]KAI5542119.1 hypothetical protein TVAGG3_0062540 [Trichomonas vaginalis G3]|eukprot:XP_001320766.1 hypothetical protein [Trichomonas vaginalis G3]
MKRSFTQRFPNITATEFIQTRLRNADFEKQIHTEGNGALLEWLPTKFSCLVRFRINVGWSDPVQRMLGSDEVVVNETRNFTTENFKQIISSNIKTNLPYLSAQISRTIEDCKDGCIETLTLEIKYNGGTFRDQIANDFFKAIAKHIFPLNNSEIVVHNIDPRPVAGLFVPPRHASQYLAIHSQLQGLREASEEYLVTIDKAKIDRKPLQIPNTNQLNQVCTLLEPDRFSIQKEIDEMKVEAQRSDRIVQEIKKTREQVKPGNSLPMFLIATCAAVIFYVASNT